MKINDPEDKIYGVLGLAIDAQSIVPSPEYSLLMNAMYSQLLESLTQARGELDWLTLGGDREADLNLPSWCPDLSRKVSRVSINTSRSMENGKSCGFSAAKYTKPDGMVLDSCLGVLTGLVVDTIDSLGPNQISENVALGIVPPR